ncbi:MAG TPA: DNA polymerase III subunit gamma/tau, partial [bacterium]|nr:DNA polymerase III subunit gamma/tau [bacterium]
MHLALARKYRPQNFLEVLGQGPVVKTLQNAIENNRLHHAYLFSGVRGVGKTSMARILAKSINCEKGPTITPCQVCGPCVAITQGNSLDVMEIDGASHNSVENVRDLREQVKYLPTSGKYKIVIIDEVHMLTGPAFNALLKTLEEPPQHIIFIFATTEPHKLPVTILSRCQKYDFRKLNTTTLQAHLKNIAMNENVEISDEALRLVTQCAQGSVRDGVSLLDQVLSYQTADITADSVSEILGLGDRVLTQKMFTTIIKEELSSGLELLQQVDERGVDLKLFAEDLLLCFRHLILLESTGKVPPELSQAESEHLHSLAGQLDLSLLLAQYQILFKGIQELAHSE